ncbi:hypothetical protein QTS76_01345 [Micromonospora sp. b486]|nr:hypothetical protein [Micromonospora sp. b486]MDM4777923.1 hypothetical protein [Micromonospora sp. b486]
MKYTSDKPEDLPWRLVLDAMIFQTEAEVRWLDHCETSLVRHRPAPIRAVDHPEAVDRAGDEARR